MEDSTEQDMRRGTEPIASVWKPIITEKERAERQQQIEAGILPF